MGYQADIYVIQKSRSKTKGIDFLNTFLPLRAESANEYLIPQYSDNPVEEFDNADDLMAYLESNSGCSQSIYWRNIDEDNPNKHGMIFYTKDGNIIFGISRNADISGKLNTENEDKCMEKMKEYFDTELGYITYEEAPVETFDEFVIRVNELNDNK